MRRGKQSWRTAPEVAPPEGATLSEGLPAGLPWGVRGGTFLFFCLQHHTCTTTGVLTPVVHRWCCKQKVFLPARTLFFTNIYFLKGLWFIHPSINPSIHANIWQSYMFDENSARIVFFRCVRNRVFDAIWSPKNQKMYSDQIYHPSIHSSFFAFCRILQESIVFDCFWFWVWLF